MRKTTAAVAILLLSGIAHRAWAEGCDGGERDVTPAEQAFFDKVKALTAALPAAPAGWVVKEDDTEEADVTTVCKDGDAALKSGNNLLMAKVSRSYERADMDARQQKIAAKGEEVQNDQPTPEQQKKIDDLDKKIADTTQKMVEAGMRNDEPARKKYSDLLDQYSKQSADLQMGKAKELAELSDKLLKDTKATITIWVNEPDWDSNYEHPAPLTVAGAAGAWREMITEKDRPATDPDSWTTVVFGPWTNSQKADDPYLRLHRGGTPIPGGTKIDTIKVKIEADHPTADLLLKGLNGGALKSAAKPGSVVKGGG
jgi:hypothetical protein